MKPRVLVLGLDGGTFSLIEPWARNGWMPNLARIMAKGCRGELKSTIPPYTPPAWASIYTGVNPGKHGVFGFFTNDPKTGSRKLCNSTSINAPKIWEILNSNGIRTGLINLPMSYPPQPLDGYMVTGPMTPPKAKVFTYPQSMSEELCQLKDPYVVNEPTHPPDTLFKRLNTATRARRTACLHLLKNNSCDFLMIIFITPDRLQHAFWKYLDENSELYDTPEAESIRLQAKKCIHDLDEAIGDIVSEVGDECLTLVVSDHGFQELSGLFILNNWLAKEGFLSYKDAGRRLSNISYKIGTKIIGNKWARAAAGQFARMTNKGDAIREIGMKTLDQTFAIDWSKTVAYASEYGLFINKNEDEYMGARQEIVNRMEKNNILANGASIAVRAFKKEEIYAGPYLDIAPDIILELGGFSYNVFESPMSQKTLIDYVHKPEGAHHVDGIFAAYGKNVAAGRKIEGATICDVAPTILSSYGIPIPAYMDGNVLNIFESDISARKSTDIAVEDKGPKPNFDDQVYSQAEEKELEKQLRDMGYI